jgi:4-hydroxy-2-oxoheptanedioate aldolase
MPAAIHAFRQALRAGRTLLGAGVSFADPLVTDALAPSVDFIWLDLEHSLMSPEALNAHLLAGRARQTPMLVRVPGSDTHTVKPVLDAGAEAVVIPQVRSADEARRFVADCRYPPAGTRGYGPRVPSDYGRKGGAAFADDANRTVMPIVMLETREALDALDDILAVPGLEALMIGPYDLSFSLGLARGGPPPPPPPSGGGAGMRPFGQVRRLFSSGSFCFNVRHDDSLWDYHDLGSRLARGV